LLPIIFQNIFSIAYYKFDITLLLRFQKLHKLFFGVYREAVTHSVMNVIFA